jgi:hypothetical protein
MNKDEVQLLRDRVEQLEAIVTSLQEQLDGERKKVLRLESELNASGNHIRERVRHNFFVLIIKGYSLSGKKLLVPVPSHKEKRLSRRSGDRPSDIPRHNGGSPLESQLESDINPFLILWLKSNHLDICFQFTPNNSLSLIRASIPQLLYLLCLDESGMRCHFVT